MNRPFFSIIVPTYNRKDQLLRLVSSVLSQTFRDFELIIVDDGSTDGTGEAISHCLANNPIIYHAQRNQERAVARNTGTRLATGTYVNFFDSDDVMDADRLERVHAFIHQRQQPTVVFSHYRFIDEAGVRMGRMERGKGTFTRALLFNNFLAANAVFLQHQVALEFPFREDRALITAEDWELWLRIHTEHPFIELNEPTFSMVQHPARSLFQLAPEKVEIRDVFFADWVAQHPAFTERYGTHAINLFRADRYSFVALAFASSKNKKRARHYAWRAATSSLWVLTRKRFWAVLKKIAWR